MTNCSWRNSFRIEVLWSFLSLPPWTSPLQKLVVPPRSPRRHFSPFFAHVPKPPQGKQCHMSTCHCNLHSFVVVVFSGSTRCRSWMQFVGWGSWHMITFCRDRQSRGRERDRLRAELLSRRFDREVKTQQILPPGPPLSRLMVPIDPNTAAQRPPPPAKNSQSDLLWCFYYPSWIRLAQERSTESLK